MSILYEQLGILEVIKDKLYEANIEATEIQKTVKRGEGLSSAKLVGIVNELVAKLGELNSK